MSLKGRIKRQGLVLVCIWGNCNARARGSLLDVVYRHETSSLRAEPSEVPRKHVRRKA